MVDLKSLGEATVALTALKSDAGKKLLAPLAEQLGIALGDLGNIYRFYQGECLEKIFTKWAASRGDKPALNQEEWRKVMPLLQLASVQGDEELQTRWAALLEHTVTTNNGFLPSFGQTLAQLTSDEAKFLDRLFNAVKNYPSNLCSCSLIFAVAKAPHHGRCEDAEY
jgi:Abortive infection alpha